MSRRDPVFLTTKKWKTGNRKPGMEKRFRDSIHICRFPVLDSRFSIHSGETAVTADSPAGVVARTHALIRDDALARPARAVLASPAGRGTVGSPARPASCGPGGAQ